MAPSRRPRKLATYRAKRDFHKTSEPAGEVARASGHSYLIQKHAARRLHYDFRLEMDGVLKSWAVTRGPSLDPADKRLAVHVEDHPLAYGKFEGTIPQGEYGGGTVMLWDRGSWSPVGDAERGYRAGRLTFDLQGERLRGRWHLVRMGGRAAGGKKENWLLIKGHDERANERNGDYALQHHLRSVVSDRTMDEIARSRKQWHSNRSGNTPHSRAAVRKSAPAATRHAVRMAARRHAKIALPAFVEPELATLATHPPRGEGWVHEVKFDGYRLLARIEDGETRLITRADNDWTDRFAGLAAALNRLKVRSALLDGEVVNQLPDGSMTFHSLQEAIGKGRQEHFHYYVFDLLFLDGEDFRGRPLLERKAALQRLLRRPPAHVHYSEHYTEPGEQVLAHACDIALEGIVSKRADRPYRSGRAMDWIKSKCIHEQEVVIGGYTEQTKNRGVLGALLTGYYRDGELIYAGKVGTGFSQDDAQRLMKRLRALKRPTRPFQSVPNDARRGACWVRPELVAQVNFSEWTGDGRMRHPSFQGLREDKPARQVGREREKRPPGARVKEQRVQSHTTTRHAAPKRGEKLEIAGVELSHPEKLLYPDAGVTKRMLAEYYQKVAPRMLPHVAGRPISLVRCPGGEGHTCFFQRHAGENDSPHLQEIKVQMKHPHPPYMMIKDVRGLIALAQMDVLEIHVWGSQAKAALKPDRLVFDFDPAPDVKFAAVKKAARDMRALLKELKLAAFLKTTGGKGLHVVVPFDRGPDWNQAKEFARSLAQVVAEHDPEHFTINMRKDLRRGKIYIDYLRNAAGASAIAPFSTRAKPGAPVSVPLRWEELAEMDSPSQFHMEDAVRRLRGDPWRKLATTRQKLPLKGMPGG